MISQIYVFLCFNDNKMYYQISKKQNYYDISLRKRVP